MNFSNAKTSGNFTQCCATFCATFGGKMFRVENKGEIEISLENTGFCHATRKGKKYKEIATLRFLSPVRLPFRHTGGTETLTICVSTPS
jgi:hypothetical protein